MATPVKQPPPPALPVPPIPLEYPESDGRPMAETDVHARCIIDSRVALENYVADEPDVYVSGNLLIYYEEGETTQSVAPDVFVVRGVPKRERRTYKLWEEGRAPDFVLEVTSRGTRGEDLGAKRGLYEWLQIPEYFLFDPRGEHLDPPLQGFRLAQGRYERMEAAADGALASERLGLELTIHDGDLRFRDPRTGRRLPTPAEEAAARRAAEARAADAEARASEADARATALEAEVARLQAALAERGSAS